MKTAAVVTLSVSIIACAQIIGVDDVTYRGPSEGGADGPVGDTNDDVTSVCHPDAIANDPKNCGACGHDCFGGQCNQSACLPFELATIAGLEPTLATNGTELFLRTANDVLHCSVSSCTNPLSLAKTVGAGVVATQKSKLYWSDQSTVLECDPTSCAPSTSIVNASPVTSVSAPWTSSWVYAGGWSLGAPPVVDVWRSPSSTGIADEINSSTQPGSIATAVAGGAGDIVYWAPVSDSIIYSCNGPCPSGPQASSTGMPESAITLLATSSALFYGSAHGLMKMSLSLGPPSPVSGSSLVAYLAVKPSTDAIIYFIIGSSPTTIEACPANMPCTATQLYLTSSSLVALAADDVSLYFIENGNRVMRLAL